MADEAVLITGISGFVGHHLASALRQSDRFRIHGTILPGETIASDDSLSDIDTIECRIEDRSSVERAVEWSNPSVVYHLAAQASVPRSLKDPEGTFQVNAMGTLYLLEALRKADDLRAVVLVSSAEIYGNIPESALPLKESVVLDPGNPYACSKACADLLGAQYFKTFHLPVVRLRPFNHIGPGQADAFAASAFARQVVEIEKGIKPPIIMVGNLEAKRDFTDVRDITQAYVVAAEKCMPGEAYNVCSGRAVSIREVLDRLLSMSSVEVEVRTDPERMRPSDIPITLGDCSKFREATGWIPQYSLDKTLVDLLDFWRAADPH